MGIFSRRRSWQDKLGEAAQEAAKEDLQRKPGFFKRLLLGNPKWKRAKYNIGREVRRDLRAEYRLEDRYDTRRRDQQRNLAEGRLRRRVGLDDAEKALYRAQRAGDPSARMLEKEIGYKREFVRRHMREYEINERYQLREQAKARERQIAQVSRDVSRQGYELKEQAEKELRRQQQRQEWQSMEAHSRPGSIYREGSLTQQRLGEEGPGSPPRVQRLSGPPPRRNPLP